MFAKSRVSWRILRLSVNARSPFQFSNEPERDSAEKGVNSHHRPGRWGEQEEALQIPRDREGRGRLPVSASARLILLVPGWHSRRSPACGEVGLYSRQPKAYSCTQALPRANPKISGHVSAKCRSSSLWRTGLGGSSHRSRAQARRRFPSGQRTALHCSSFESASRIA